MNRKILGDCGEEAVAQFLKSKNFKIITQNYLTRYGEIDLIAQKDDILAFIEVKTRKTVHFPISNVVTWRKQQKIVKTAKYYIIQNNIINKACRFDIATVIQSNNGYEVDYLENAFLGR